MLHKRSPERRPIYWRLLDSIQGVCSESGGSICERLKSVKDVWGPGKSLAPKTGGQRSPTTSVDSNRMFVSRKGLVRHSNGFTLVTFVSANRLLVHPQICTEIRNTQQEIQACESLCKYPLIEPSICSPKIWID